MEQYNYSIWMIGICVLFFIFQSLIPNFTETFLLSSEKPFEIWRFVSAMFLHGDIVHLLYNMLALFMFGLALERFLGSKKFLLIYFASGIIANIISINFYSSSLGASGAIFGVIGALVIIRPGLSVFAFGLPMPMVIAGALWAIIDLIGIFTPSNVANISHLSGMAVGIIVASFYKDWNRKERIHNKITLDENYISRWEDEHLR